MVLTTRLYTVEDLWAMPGDEPWELWDGELRMVPGTGGQPSRVAGRIFSKIDSYLEVHDLGVVTTSDGSYVLEHPGTVVVPDVAYVSWDHLPGREMTFKYITVPPDLAVEVQSSTDEPKEMAAKRALYARGGVRLLWWVDLMKRTVTVYRSGDAVEVLQDGDVLAADDVLPGLRIAVSDVFPSLRPR